MNRLAVTTALLLGTASQITANPLIDGPGTNTPFAGPYVGVVVGSVSGDANQELDPGQFLGTLDYTDGTSYGGVAGYNFQMEAFVYGGEIKALGLNDFTPEVGDGSFNRPYDLRGRVGQIFGDAMIYGAGGFSQATNEYPGGSRTFTGFNFGFGIEYNLDVDLPYGIQNPFLSADYTMRKLEFQASAGDDVLHHNLDTLAVGIGVRF